MSTYSSRLRARLDLQHQKQFGQKGFWLPEDVHELHYNQELNGTRDGRKPNICQSCFIALPSTNICSECEVTYVPAAKPKIKKEHTDEWL